MAAGDALVLAQVEGQNGANGGEAIYRTEADGRLTTIAQTGGLIRDFYLSPFMNDSSTVSFGADLTDGAQAVFTGSGGALTRIADTEPASPFSSIPFPAPRIDARGTVYFRATLRSGATGKEDGTSLFSPKSRSNLLSFADDLGVDVCSWE